METYRAVIRYSTKEYNYTTGAISEVHRHSDIQEADVLQKLIQQVEFVTDTERIDWKLDNATKEYCCSLLVDTYSCPVRANELLRWKKALKRLWVRDVRITVSTVTSTVMTDLEY